MSGFQQETMQGKRGGGEASRGETAAVDPATAARQSPGSSSKKKKRSLPGTPAPDAEVVALSPGTLMATNRFTCEICSKGFQRDQNLQLHRRGHNLPWKLRQRGAGAEARKRVYVCPVASCVHHSPARALGDLTGIKKHYCRKHGEKKWGCGRCSKRYAVQSDWKAHMKVCGTKEYKCDCGIVFSRRDSFVTHRAFCDVLTEESSRYLHRNDQTALLPPPPPPRIHLAAGSLPPPIAIATAASAPFPYAATLAPFPALPCTPSQHHLPAAFCEGPYGAYTSATALLQKAAQMGPMTSSLGRPPAAVGGAHGMMVWGQGDVMTVDFMGVAAEVLPEKEVLLHPFGM